MWPKRDKKDQHDGESDVQIDTDTELDDSVIAEESLQETIKKLRERLKKCESEKQEYLAGWQRDKADFINTRRRENEAREELVKFANESLIEDLLPALESFELAISHGEKGIVPVYNQFLQILKRRGLEEENPTGRPFDPHHHESVGIINTKNKDDDHKVLEVVQKGYSLNGKTIRPAKVKIGEYAEVNSDEKMNEE